MPDTSTGFEQKRLKGNLQFVNEIVPNEDDNNNNSWSSDPDSCTVPLYTTQL